MVRIHNVMLIFNVLNFEGHSEPDFELLSRMSPNLRNNLNEDGSI